VDITYDEALRLYKTLLETVKSPFIDIMEIIPNQDTSERTPPPHVRTSARSVPLSSFTKEEEKTITEFYLNLQDTQKVSQKMILTRGQSEKWAVAAISDLLKYVLKKAIKKIIDSRKRYLNRAAIITFSDC
jgi:hypothetical protein